MDRLALMATDLAPVETSWSKDQVILYHLGLGAGAAPLDEDELAYVDELRLKVLPTFAVVSAGQASTQMAERAGLLTYPERILHVAQQLTVYEPIPAQASVLSTARIEAVWDRGSAAVVVVRVDLEYASRPLCVTRFHLRLEGQGGFSGDRGGAWTGAPEREPDLFIRTTTAPQLSAIYRLSGDRHRLHIDPPFARAAGFARPILPGLCTWGVVGKAVVDTVLGGDPDVVRDYDARFTAPVMPGETLVTAVWRDPSHDEIIVEATVLERNARALAGSLRVAS